jgi:hypothetical protein
MADVAQLVDVPVQDLASVFFLGLVTEQLWHVHFVRSALLRLG